MKLLLERIFTNNTYTIGHLYQIDEYTNEKQFICDTIEDCDRGLDEAMSVTEVSHIKVYMKTAIPTGHYDIIMNVKSPKYSNFKKYPSYKEWDAYLPRFKKVLGFEGVLIHIGNTAVDSGGCILVGENKVKGQVINSTVTFRRLMNEYLVPCKERGEAITLDIVAKY